MSDDKTSLKRTGARLRKARIASGLKQSDVAEKAGISVNHYAQIERGEKDTTTSVFKAITKAIDVSSSDILDA